MKIAHTTYTTKVVRICYYMSMDVRDHIERMMSRAGLSARALSLALGRSQNFVTNSLRQNSSMRLATFVEIAHKTGYRLMLRGHGEEIEIGGGEGADSDQGTADRR